MLLLSNCKSDEEKLSGISPVPISFIHLKVKIPIKGLEDGINNVLGMQLYDGGFALDKNLDSLFLTIQRTGAIELNLVGGKLYVEVPLDVASVIKKKVLGIALNNIKNPFIFKARARMSLDLEINEKWDLVCHSKWEELQWEQKPTVRLFGIELNLGALVEDQISKNIKLVETSVDHVLDTKINMNQSIAQVYGISQNPVQIAKKPLALFLKNTPTDFRGIFSSLESSDTLIFHLEHLSQFSISPTMEGPTIGVSLGARRDPMSTESHLSLFTELRMSFVDIERTLEALIVGQKFNFEGIEGSVKSIEIRPMDGFLNWRLTIEGDLAGTIQLFVIPHIDDELLLRFSAFDYELSEVTGLAKITYWAMHDAIEKYVTNKTSVDLAPFLNQLDDKILEALKKSTLSQKMSLDLHLNKFKSYSKGMNNEEMQVIFQIEGSADIVLKPGIFVGSKSAK